MKDFGAGFSVNTNHNQYSLALLSYLIIIINMFNALILIRYMIIESFGNQAKKNTKLSNRELCQLIIKNSGIDRIVDPVEKF